MEISCIIKLSLLFFHNYTRLHKYSDTCKETYTSHFLSYKQTSTHQRCQTYLVMIVNTQTYTHVEAYIYHGFKNTHKLLSAHLFSNILLYFLMHTYVHTTNIHLHTFNTLTYTYPLIHRAHTYSHSHITPI